MARVVVYPDSGASMALSRCSIAGLQDKWRNDIRLRHTVGLSIVILVIMKTLQITGFFDIRCDAHTFMQASMHVFEHPYFTMTDSTGRFEMAQVPPGTYRLRMWHEALGARTKTITVPSTGPLILDLGLSPEE